MSGSSPRSSTRSRPSAAWRSARPRCWRWSRPLGVLPHRRDRQRRPRLVALNLGAEDFALSAGMLPTPRGCSCPSRPRLRRARRRHHADGVYRHGRRVPRSRRLPRDGAPLAPARLFRRLGDPPEPGRDPQRGIPPERRRRSITAAASSPPTTRRSPRGSARSPSTAR